MASKSRKRIRAAKRAAAASIAAATVTALVVGTAPLPVANAASVPIGSTSAVPTSGTVVVTELVNLLALSLSSNLAATPGSPGLPPMALAPGAPDPASIPDLTFGLGPRGYEAFQTYGAQLESAILNSVNLSGVLQNLGYDPETAINTALGNALVSALTGVTLPVGDVPVIGGVLTNAGVTNVAALLALLGVNLADPLGLSGPTPGLNIITTGPPFSLLKFLGIDLGWVPGFPNSVADEINGTQYLGISPVALLETLKGMPGVTAADRLILDPLILTAEGIFGDTSAIDVRVPVVIGFGLGAFAAGMAYPQVVADLENQPGGAQYVGTSPLAGSLTILPMILLRNPGRANGGLFARFYPQAGLLGIDTVTPDTEVSSSSSPGGLNIPVGTTGIVLGGANLIPIKIDGTVEYDPLSDFPAWPNPVSLANSAAALFFPTYILRGVNAASLTEVVTNQLTPQLAAALGNTSGPLALNLYLTVPVNGALPLLEPVKLPIDVINLFTGANLNNPIATAFEPFLTTLTNLGYTDVKRTVVNGVPVYDRTLDQANVITPFGTLPSGVDWGQVPGDLLVQLAAGIQKAISDGIVSSTPVVNPLGILANLLGINGLPGAASAVSPLSGLTTSAIDAAAAAVPTAVQSQGAAPSAANALAANDVDTDTDAGGTVPAAVQSQGPAPSAKNVSSDTDIDADTDADDVDKTPAKPDNPSNTGPRVKPSFDASVKNVADGFGKVVKDVGDNVQKTLSALSGADKPADKPSESGADKPSDDSTG